MLNKNAIHGTLVLLLASLFYTYEFIHRLTPGAMIPELMQAYQISATELGTLSAMYFYSYGVFQIPAGIIVDRYPLRIVLGFACLLVSLGSYIQYQYISYPMVLVARAMIGAGSAFGFVSCVKIGTTWFHEHRLPFIIGLTNLFGVLGAFIGGAPLASGVNMLGWEKVYELISYVGLVLAALSFIFIKIGPFSDEYSKEPCFKKTIVQLLSSRLTWLIACYAALTVAPIAAFAELWSLPFFENYYGLSRPDASYANSFIFLGIAFGGPAIGWAASTLQFSTRFLMRLFSGAALMALSFILIGNIPGYTFLLAALFLYGFFTSHMLLAFSLVTRLHKSQCTGLVIGFTNMIITIAGAVFQPTIGWIIDRITLHLDSTAPEIMLSTSIQVALLPLAGCLFITVLIALFTPIPTLSSSSEKST